MNMVLKNNPIQSVFKKGLLSISSENINQIKVGKVDQIALLVCAHSLLVLCSLKNEP